MAFNVPTFNLTVEIFTGPWLSKSSRGTVLGNLAQGKRLMPTLLLENSAPVNFTTTSELLLPAGTDVRDGSTGGPADIVEVPQGSGRWYSVLCVDDFGKGFLNEHRFALLHKVFQQLNPIDFAGANWPTPIP